MSNEFKKMEEREAMREIIKFEDLESLDLAYLEQFDCKYILFQGKKIFVDIVKRPVKGGTIVYEARGYDFIKLLEEHKLFEEFCENCFTKNCVIIGKDSFDRNYNYTIVDKKNISYEELNNLLFIKTGLNYYISDYMDHVVIYQEVK